MSDRQTLKTYDMKPHCASPFSPPALGILTAALPGPHIPKELLSKETPGTGALSVKYMLADG